MNHVDKEISIRYDPRNIITMLAYTLSLNGEPSEFIGVVRARNFDREQMSLDELEWVCQELRQQKKEVDNNTIYVKCYRQLNSIEEKRSKKRRSRKQEQQKRDEITNQSKIIEIFPQNEPSTPVNNVVELRDVSSANPPSKKSKVIDEPKISSGNSEKTEKPKSLKQTMPKMRRRSSGIEVDIKDWNNYIDSNW